MDIKIRRDEVTNKIKICFKNNHILIDENDPINAENMNQLLCSILDDSPKGEIIKVNYQPTAIMSPGNEKLKSIVELFEEFALAYNKLENDYQSN